MNERQDPTQVRGFGMLATVGLLRPGVTLPQAAAEMETITSRLRQQYPDTNNRRFNRVVSLHKHLVGETGSMLLLLFGAVEFRFADRVRERREPAAGERGRHVRKKWPFELRWALRDCEWSASY